MRWLGRSAIDIMLKHMKFVEIQGKKQKRDKNKKIKMLTISCCGFSITTRNCTKLANSGCTFSHHIRITIKHNSWLIPPIQAPLITLLLPTARLPLVSYYFLFIMFCFCPSQQRVAQPMWRILVAPWMTTLLRSRLLLRYPRKIWEGIPLIQFYQLLLLFII